MLTPSGRPFIDHGHHAPARLHEPASPRDVQLDSSLTIERGAVDCRSNAQLRTFTGSLVTAVWPLYVTATVSVCDPFATALVSQ